MRLLRTPEERFDALLDFPFPPRYVEVPASDDPAVTLRVHYLDEGPRDGAPVLLLHGEPSWGYLYRHMVGPLVAAGLRVVVPDLPGFGRSDKPTQLSDYSYARLVSWMRAALFDALNLSGITLFGQDWGGLVGLRLVAAEPQRFAAVVAANTGLPDGTARLPAPWWRFHDFVARTPDLPVSMLVSRGCATPLAPGELAGYDAPFPAEQYKAGPRALPGLVPQDPGDPAVPDQQAAWAVLGRFTAPVVCAFSDSDPITRGGDRILRERIPGAAQQRHVTVPGGHFLQEDSPELLAGIVAEVASAVRR